MSGALKSFDLSERGAARDWGIAAQVFSLLVSALICAAASAESATSADGAARYEARYQSLLDDYLRVTSAPGAPLETRFDYFKLYRAPDRAVRLKTLHDALIAVVPAKLDAAERRAWGINAYNFFVIERITTNLIPINPKGTTRVSSVRSIKIDKLGFFEAPVATIDGRMYTLDQFEHRFVFDRPDDAPKGAKAPATLDPRAHFALVCGAVGCPPLQPRAFRAESLDTQLDRATRDALASPRHLLWSGSRLAGSSVFSWYEADFGGPANAVRFALLHAPESVRVAASAKPRPGFDRFIPWDWELNAVAATKASAKGSRGR